MNATVAGRSITFTCHAGLLAGEGLPNSLAAVDRCLEAGVARIEIDIHSMADGEYLVCHANRLEDATTSHGAVGRLTRDEALALRDRLDPMSRPPLLSEAVALVAPHDCELQLDLKDWRPLSPERADALGQLVRPLGERVIVSSGQDWNLRAIAQRVPALRLGFDPDRYLCIAARAEAPVPGRLGAHGYRDDHPLALGRAQAVDEYLRARFEMLAEQAPAAGEFFIEYRLLLQAAEDGARIADVLHARGVSVSAWTLDYNGPPSLAALERLAAAGVDRITTNTAQQFLEALAA